jgi:hypothetical protein
MNALFRKLSVLKEAKNNDHGAVIQFKVDQRTRDHLLKRLEEDGLNYKDLFSAAIDVYLNGETE